jgi:hypothetical protein
VQSSLPINEIPQGLAEMSTALRQLVEQFQINEDKYGDGRAKKLVN